MHRFLELHLAGKFLFRLGPAITDAGILHQPIELNRQFVLGYGLHDAVGLAPQPERIFRPAGDQAQRKHSGNAVGLIGNREHSPLDGARYRVIHRLGFVVVIDRNRDALAHFIIQVLVQRLHAGVKSAHDALQFGEFLYQFSRQISLRQAGGFMNDSGPESDALLF